MPTVEREVRTGLVWSMAIAGRDAVDAVDLRLVHAVEELARVGRERLDVAPLALGVERVEHERRLARAGHAGDDDQLVERQVEVRFLRLFWRAPRICMAPWVWSCKGASEGFMRKGNLRLG